MRYIKIDIKKKKKKKKNTSTMSWKIGLVIRVVGIKSDLF